MAAPRPVFWEMFVADGIIADTLGGYVTFLLLNEKT